MAEADALRDAGTFADAAEKYANISRQYPNFFAAWAQLGNMRKELGEFKLAETAYEQAFAIDPTNVDVITEMAALYDAKRLHSIAEIWRTAVKSCGETSKSDSRAIISSLSVNLSRLASTLGQSASSDEVIVEPAANLDELLRNQELGRSVFKEVVQGLLQREPDEQSLQAYSGALASGYRLSELILEIIKSSEFKSKIFVNDSFNLTQESELEKVSPEVVHLAEDLLVERLVEQGFRIPKSPRQADLDQLLDLDTTRSMLWTLAT